MINLSLVQSVYLRSTFVDSIHFLSHKNVIIWCHSNLITHYYTISLLFVFYNFVIKVSFGVGLLAWPCEL